MATKSRERNVDVHRIRSLAIISMCGLLAFFAPSASSDWDWVGAVSLAFYLFVPGAVLIVAVYRNSIEHTLFFMALALGLSPVMIVATALPALWLLGIDLDTTRLAFLAIIAMMAAIELSRKKVQLTPRTANDRPQRAELVAVIGLFGILLALQIAVMLSPENRLSIHGVFHGSIITQILQGRVPPENPGLAGYPANIYWPLHLSQAFLVRATGLGYTTVHAVHQIAMFTTFVFAFYGIARVLLKGRDVAGAMAVGGFGSNLIAPFAFLFAISMGALAEIDWSLVKVLGSLGPWLGHMTRAGMFVEFLVFGGYPTGLALFVVLLYGVVKERPVVASAALLGLLLLHPTSGLPGLLVIPLAWVIASASSPLSIATELRTLVTNPQRRTMALAFVLPALVCFPYLLDASREFKGDPFEIGFSLFSFKHSILLYVLTLPVFMFAVWRHWGDQQAIRFLSLVALGSLLLAGFLRVPGENQYKIIYLGGLALNLIAFFGLSALIRNWTRFVRNTLAGLALAYALIVGLSWSLLPSGFEHRIPQFANGFLTLSHEPAESVAIAWIAQNLPPDSVVIENVDYCESSYVGAIAGVRSYFVPCSIFTLGHDETPIRTEEVVQTFSGNAEAVTTTLGIIGGKIQDPVFVMLSRSRNPDDFEARRSVFLSVNGLSSVYEAPNVVIFALRS